jgi:hypothetical protein
MKFQFLMAVSVKMAAFWDLAPCSLVETDETTWRYIPEG